ncbi:ATP-binding protein [Chitinophagaceae bacterium MMS25-I14]
MSSSGQTKKVTGSIYSKLAIAFVLACITVALSWAVTKNTFRHILGTVKQISAPNPKLKLVNHLFRDVLKQEQRQRIQALKNSRNAYNPYIRESQQVQRLLDTLQDMSDTGTAQWKRVDSMKQLLRQRDKLFVSYLQLNQRFGRDTQLSVKVRELSAFLTSDSARKDSSVVTTEHRITTTKLVGADSASQTEPQERSFWDKIFGRKKPSEITHAQKQIQEELSVRIDTLAIAKEDSLMTALGYTLQNIENDRESKRVTLTTQQMQIVRASNTIVSQLLEMLQDIESEEILRTEQNNETATGLVDESIERMSLILLGFIVGSGVLIFLVIADVARSNQYRRELVVAKEEAERLEQVKQRFLSNMSHELRTPLQTILGFSEQLKDQTNPKQEDIDIIYRSSRHLLQIVNEVLDYSRIVSGKFSFNPQPFDMKAVLEEVAAVMQVQASRKNLDFHFNTDMQEPQWVTGDAFRLRQVLFNILGNAVKFTTHGSVTFDCIHSSDESEINFSFTINDTGPGIPEQDLDKIFTQFEQATNNTGNLQSTGLGLTIARMLIEEQGGTITADSREGAGAMFTVAIRYPVAVALPDEQLPVLLPAATFDSMVWIVDDDPFILQLCSAILRKYDIPHETFSNPLDALNATSSVQIENILLDIRMPDMDGITLMRRLREKELTANAQFIALTAQALPDEQRYIMEQGFDLLLMKPFTETELLDILGLITYGDEENSSDDLSHLKSMAGNDEVLMQKIVHTFISESDEDVTLLNNAWRSGHYETAAHYLHRLAGRFGQMGFTEISSSLRQAETNLYNGETNMDIYALLEDLQQYISSLRSIV